MSGRRRSDVVVGVVVLGESASPMRLCAAGMIVGGIVLMKWASA